MEKPSTHQMTLRTRKPVVIVVKKPKAVRAPKRTAPTPLPISEYQYDPKIRRIPETDEEKLVACLQADVWTWNHNSKQNNVFIMSHGNCVVINPIFAVGTVGVRGIRDLTKKGLTYWRINFSPPLSGTSIMFGVATANANLHEPIDYTNLLGYDNQSWGLHHRGYTYHNKVAKQFMNALPIFDKSCIGVLFDSTGDVGKMSYYVNGQFMGVGFDNIPLNQPLFPVVSSTCQCTRFFLLDRFVRNEMTSSLKHLAASAIGRIVESPDKLKKLPVPDILQPLLRERWDASQITLGYPYVRTTSGFEKAPIINSHVPHPSDCPCSICKELGDNNIILL
uniref:B30.2/SPRY domain-containing protein n=1 Tax=Rhabditophanes sp. KR3021 TaxID=114890 RepID=A0AC35U8F1_9BILA